MGKEENQEENYFLNNIVYLCTIGGEAATVAYASRVYSFLCMQALTWKTEYTRDAYAVPARFSVGVQKG